ncbi:hypothetical protein BGZ72_008846 [Mortierella alpina]|nr:hypothetical protein BGZ72_008846 [Mortierella alpina]
MASMRPTAIARSKVNGPSSSASTSAAKVDSKRGPFWVKPGMIPFVHWLTDAENQMSFRKGSGETSKENLDKLRAHVKEKSGIDWTFDQAKRKVQYAKSRYDEANTLWTATDGNTDAAALRSKMLALCPYYDQFHAVYGGSLVWQPPPPQQSITILDDESITLEHDQDPDDVDDAELNDDFEYAQSDSTSEQSVASCTGRDETPSPKRLRIERPKSLSATSLEMHRDEIRTIGRGSGSGRADSGGMIELEKERWRQILRKELVLEERENSWLARRLEVDRALDEKLKKREQEHEEAMRRRFKEHEETIRRRTEEVESRLKQRMEEYKIDKAELREMQSRFQEAQRSLLVQLISTPRA